MSAPAELEVRPIDHVVQFGADADDALVLRAGTVSYKDLRSRVAQLAG